MECWISSHRVVPGGNRAAGMNCRRNILKTLKYLGVATILATTLATAGHAQTVTDNVVFGASGSSALFNVLGQAAEGLSGIVGHYSAKKAANVIQASPAGIPAENGQIFIAWTAPDSSNVRQVYFYVQEDSTVGNRAFFNKNTVKLVSPMIAPGNIVPGSSGDVVPPSDILSLFGGAGAPLNAAGTDITPYDALVRSQTTLALGYTATNPVKGVNGTNATPVAFDFSNFPNFVDTQVGAAALVVFVNSKLPDSTGPSSLANANNIDTFTLANVLNGTLKFTDVVDEAQTNDAGQPMPVFMREPLSGTYATIENDIVASQAVKSTQEAGVTPVAATNPLNEAGYNPASPAVPVATGGRVRIVGTGDLITAVNNVPDALGYAFYSVGSFSGKNNLKYLTVNGADPIQATYSGGAFPAGGGTLTNIANGAYPIWSLLRVVTASALTSDQAVYLNAVGALNGGGDFIIPKFLNVFRSHRAVNGSAAHNGVTVKPESGADSGGAIFPNNAEIDLGVEITGQRQ